MTRARLQIMRLFAALAVFLAGAGLWGPPGLGSPPPAHAQDAAARPFTPITVAHTGPSMSGGIMMGGLPISGDWVGYTLGNFGCGHCGPYISTIRLRNMVTSQEISIRLALREPYYDVPQPPTGIQFAGPHLLWRQAAQTSDPHFQAGTYACGLCLYDLHGNQNLPLPPDPPCRSLWCPYFQAGTYACGLCLYDLRGNQNLPHLLWRQSAQASDPHFQAGTYSCGLCLYDLRSNQNLPIPPFQGVDPTVQAGMVPVALDPQGSGRALLVWDDNSGKGSQVYLVNLLTGQARQLPIATKFDSWIAGVVNGALIALNVGNTSGDPGMLFLYRESDNTTRQIAVGHFNSLQTDGTDLYWSGANNMLQRWHTASETIETLSGSSYNFAVSHDLIAWTQPNGPSQPGTLNIRQLNSGKTILQTAMGQKGPDEKEDIGLIAGLSDDKISMVGEDDNPLGGAPVDQRLSVAWLLAPDPAFQRVWAPADAPVAAGTAPRSWLWGPQPRFIAKEAYAAGPDGQHLVEYFDKARMEVNNPRTPTDSPYYVTNGLLTVEMVSGEFQTGNTTAIRASVPCTIPVVGDPRKDNPLTPDYATMAVVASLHGDHQAPDRTGQAVDDAIDVAGVVSKDATHGALDTYARYLPQTGHNIPGIFAHYLQTMPSTFGFDQDTEWTVVLGYPITDAYWTQMRVGGKDYPVLVQLFQRRVLTYIPDFDPVWRVQQGNAGQHYLEWRYTLNQGRP